MGIFQIDLRFRHHSIGGKQSIRDVAIPREHGPVDQWIQAANITSGKLFRPVHKGWEKLGREADGRVGLARGSGECHEGWIDKLAPLYLRRTCARLCYAAEGELVNWSKSSFCSVMFQFRQRNDILAASSGFKVQSTTKSE
jgi:hypothetical protein